MFRDTKQFPPSNAVSRRIKGTLTCSTCMDGGELIGWKLASSLRIESALDQKSDVQFYARPQDSTKLRMSRGNFAVFFPIDAHAPKEFNGVDRSVFKVVVKIDRDLV